MKCVRCQCDRVKHMHTTDQCLQCKDCEWFVFQSEFSDPPKVDSAVAQLKGEIFENWDSFFAELEGSSVDALDQIKIAYIFAKGAHASTYRSEVRCGVRVRYFEHVREAALIAIRRYRVRDPFIISLILLHDVGEDSMRLTIAILRKVFDQGSFAKPGNSVAESIALLSKMPGHKSAYVPQLSKAESFPVLFTKGCDRLHNLRTVSPKARDKQAKETEEMLYPLFDLMIALAPVNYVHAARQLREDIHATVAQLKKDTLRELQRKEVCDA